MTPRAHIALRAAHLERTIGSFAARRYAERNGVGRLYVIARQLLAAETNTKGRMK